MPTLPAPDPPTIPTDPTPPPPSSPPSSVQEILAALDGRESLEGYIKQQMAATAAHYENLIASYQRQEAAAAAEGLINDMAKAANGMRAAIKDKDPSRSA